MITQRSEVMKIAVGLAEGNGSILLAWCLVDPKLRNLQERAIFFIA